jgi:hypothetical protein
MTAVTLGQRYGAWTVARTDTYAKRAWCICKCGTTRQLAAEALLIGESRGCGCRLTPRNKARKPAPAPPDFSNEIAAIEQFVSGRARRRR